jgi:hypothetical protein
MKLVLLPLLVLILPLGACDVELTEPPRDTPPRFALAVTSSDSSAGVLRLDASFLPGFDDQGAPRRASGDTMEVDGVKLTPTGTDERGERRYSRDWSFTAGSPGPLVVRVRAPEVEGLEAETPELSGHIPHRVGPHDLRIAPGDPIRLRMADVDMLPESSQITSQLKLQRIGGGPPVFRLEFAGAPPGEITIPAEWIPGGTGSGALTATLTVVSSSSVGVSDLYPALITIFATSSWSLHLD